jgi:hypothetical protein
MFDSQAMRVDGDEEDDDDDDDMNDDEEANVIIVDTDGFLPTMYNANNQIKCRVCPRVFINVVERNIKERQKKNRKKTTEKQMNDFFCVLSRSSSSFFFSFSFSFSCSPASSLSFSSSSFFLPFLLISVFFFLFLCLFFPLSRRRARTMKGRSTFAAGSADWRRSGASDAWRLW